MDKKSIERERGTTIKAMESSLVGIRSTLELPFPPADAPVEAMIAAQEWQELRMREVTGLLSVERKTLREFVRRYHRLSRQSTTKFERSKSPDEYVPESVEIHRAREAVSRRAQIALQAAAKESPHPEKELGTALKSVEDLLQARIQLTRDLLLPATDSPDEVKLAAQERRESKTRIRNVIALWTEELLAFKEIGGHRRLLCEESTATLEWGNVPDVYIPMTREEERLLKPNSRPAQDKPPALETGRSKHAAAE